MKKPKKKKPVLYTTSQLNLKAGDQVRITFGRRTIFVYCNARGMNINRGGYCPIEKPGL